MARLEQGRLPYATPQNGKQDRANTLATEYRATCAERFMRRPMAAARWIEERTVAVRIEPSPLRQRTSVTESVSLRLAKAA